MLFHLQKCPRRNPSTHYASSSSQNPVDGIFVMLHEEAHEDMHEDDLPPSLPPPPGGDTRFHMLFQTMTELHRATHLKYFVTIKRRMLDK